MNKKKNVLAYVSLVCFITICAILGFVIGTQHSTPDENGKNGVETNKVGMTKVESSNYLETFMNSITSEYDNINEVTNSDIFYFAVKVYLKQKGKNQVDSNAQEYKIPSEEIMEIANRYFGKKGFKYNPTEQDKYVKYNEQDGNYIIESTWYSENKDKKVEITIVDIISSNNKKIAILKIKSEDSIQPEEYTCILNNENNIISYKKNEVQNVAIIDEIIGNFEFKNTSLTYENGSSVLRTEVTNISNQVQNISEFYFHIIDASGNEMVKLTGYIGENGIKPGETRQITSSYGEDVTSFASIRYEIGPITTRKNATIKKDIYEFKDTTIELKDGMTTLSTKVTNTSNEIQKLPEIYFHIKDESGNEIVKLVGYVAGNEIKPGETRPIIMTYGKNIISYKTIDIELEKKENNNNNQNKIVKQYDDGKVEEFEFKDTTITFENKVSTLRTQVTNTSSKHQSVSEFYFYIKDTSGNVIVKLIGYIGENGIKPGETKTIYSSYGENITSFSKLEYQVETNKKEEKIINVPDKKIGVYELKNTTVTYENGTSVLKTELTNTSNQKQNVFELVFHVKDKSGKELVRLTGYIGENGLKPKEIKTIYSSYGEDITTFDTIDIEVKMNNQIQLVDD